MAYSQRLSAGVAQTISRRVNTNVLYSYGYRYALLTGPQPQHADQRRQARPRLRQRRARHGRRLWPAAHGERVDEHEPRAAAADRRPGRAGLAARMMMMMAAAVR